MYIILMRHGEAEPQTEDVANRDRRLTGKGRKQVFRSARALARFMKETPIRIFTSPFVRTPVSYTHLTLPTNSRV